MKLLAVLEATTAHFTKHGLSSPRLQAELLIAHALNLPRLALYLQFERELTPSELEALRPLVRRRASRERRGEDRQGRMTHPTGPWHRISP